MINGDFYVFFTWKKNRKKKAKKVEFQKFKSIPLIFGSGRFVIVIINGVELSAIGEHGCRFGYRSRVVVDFVR